MLDQCHNIEPKIPGQIRSVMNVQEATAKALLVDRAALAAAQRAGDVLGANAVLMDAYDTDVRPLLRRGADRDGPRPGARWGPTPGPGTPSGSSPSGSAGRPRGGAHDRRTDRRRSQALLERSHRLGADPRNTNYAGGNTSAKGTAIDPVTGAAGRPAVGQGVGRRPRDADRGRPGRAPARPAARAASTSIPGVEREDEMVAAFDYCLHGRGGAAPSIDTAMHGLVEADHVDHLHPDAGIAFATAADGEELTAALLRRPGRLGPWRRPGFQLGLDIAAIRRDRPEAIGAILGGHGITAWGETSDACEANSLEIIRTAERFIAEHGRADPFGAIVPRLEPLPARLGASARGRAAAGAARPRVDGPAAGRPLQRRGGRARLPVARRAPAAGRARDVVPGPLPADQGRADGARPAAERAARGDRRRGSRSCTRPTARTYARVLRAARDARQPGRCAAPTRRSCSSPGVGMFSFGANKQTARVAGEFYVNAINVMRGAEALSTLRPDRRVREVPHRVLGARGGQARPDAEAEAARRPGSRS